MRRFKPNPITEFILETDPVFKEYLPELSKDIENREFVFDKTNHFPTPLKRVLLRNAFREKTFRDRNLYLLRTSRKLDGFLPEAIRNQLMLDEDGISELSEKQAAFCEKHSDQRIT